MDHSKNRKDLIQPRGIMKIKASLNGEESISASKALIGS